MKIKKFKNFGVIFLISILAFLAGGIFVRSIKANSNNSTFPPIVERLVEKFNLNKTEVEKVVEEYRNERIQQKKQLMEERLSQAVKDGVINESQKQALLKKFEEIIQRREQEKQEFQNWLSNQGIDMQKLAPYLGKIRGRCGFKGMGPHMW